MMALKRCKECGAEVSAEAETCPHCGAPGPKKRSEKTVEAAVGIGCVIVLLIGVGTCLSRAEKLVSEPRAPEANQVYTQEDKDGAQRVLKDLAQKGLVKKVDLAAGRIWWDDAAWALMNRDQKVQALEGLAAACHILAGDWDVKIVSYSNDQPLGRFSRMSGAEIER